MQKLIDELTRMHQALFGADLRPLTPGQVRSHLEAGHEDLILVCDDNSVVLGRLENDVIPYFDPQAGKQEMALADLLGQLESGHAVCLEKA